MSDAETISARATDNFKARAWFCRSGIGSVNQEFNNSYQRGQKQLNIGNCYWTADMKQATITNVQHSAFETVTIKLPANGSQNDE